MGQLLRHPLAQNPRTAGVLTTLPPGTTCHLLIRPEALRPQRGLTWGRGEDGGRPGRLGQRCPAPGGPRAGGAGRGSGGRLVNAGRSADGEGPPSGPRPRALSRGPSRALAAAAPAPPGNLRRAPKYRQIDSFETRFNLCHFRVHLKPVALINVRFFF